MFFFTLDNADIRFAKQELVQITYRIVKTLSTTQKVEITDKKEFVAVALNKNNETFMIYMTTLSIRDLNIHLFQNVQIALLQVEKVTIPSEYTDYTNIFFPNSAVEQLKYININDDSINLIDDKQPPYSLIYSLEPIKLKMLKTYIKTYLTNGFIRSSKSLAGALILFICKKNDNL